MVAARKANVFMWLEGVAVITLIGAVVATWSAFSRSGAPDDLLPTMWVSVLLMATLVPAMALLVLIGRRLALRRWYGFLRMQLRVAPRHFREHGSEVGRPEGQRRRNAQAATQLARGQDRFPGRIHLRTRARGVLAVLAVVEMAGDHHEWRVVLRLDQARGGHGQAPHHLDRHGNRGGAGRIRPRGA